jgi:hypothetical protein
MLIITNLVEHTKQYLPSILIKNQVQDNGQKRLVILNRHPPKLIQSNAKCLIKLLGQKIKGTLAFNHRVVAQNIFIVILFQALEPHSFYSHQPSAQAYKANKQTTKNNTPIKRVALKERTKGYARLDGSLKNTKRSRRKKGLVSFKEMAMKG